MVYPLFLTNLAETCKHNQLIRKDGKQLTLFNRIGHRFQSKKSHDDFVVACRTLSGAANDGYVKNLSPKERIEIIGRFRQIQGRIKNPEIRKECYQHIRIMERAALKEDFDEILKQTYKDIENSKLYSSPHKNNKEMNRQLGKLNALVSHAAKDPVAHRKMIDSWMQSLLSKKSLNNIELDKAQRAILLRFLTLEEEILKLSDEVPSERYFFLLNRYLVEYFSGNLRGANKLLVLKDLMEKHKDNPEFIEACCRNIEQFLRENVFSKGLHSNEMMKDKLLALSRPLFSILNEYLPTIEDRGLIVNLKIGCANLPSPSKRSDFPNLILTDIDQLKILIGTLGVRENERTAQLAVFLKMKNPSLSDIPPLARLLSDPRELDYENRQKLRRTLEERFKGQKIDWNDRFKVESFLAASFKEGLEKTNLIDSLKRTAKAKHFFVEQEGLDEYMITIPRWYHATKNIYPILKSGEIQVRHERVYKGAWISSQREQYGPYTIALSHRIADLDPQATIGYRYQNKRWRGIQRPIPLAHPDHHVAIVGLAMGLGKTTRKIEKLKIIDELKILGFENPSIYSHAQLDFMRNEVESILGHPNLSSNWY